MRIVECEKIKLEDFGLEPKDNVFFIRIDPEDLSKALLDILEEVSNLSWLNKFDPGPLQRCMEENAEETCRALKDKFKISTGEPCVSEAGEYIVSVYSKRGVVEELGHKDIPLAELVGRKTIGNPGFDFFTEETNLQLVTCGEAKYVHGKNAYTTSLNQINDFIDRKKHIKDIIILNGFATNDSLINLTNDKLGICSAFSSTAIPTKNLISNICANTDFKKALKYDYIVLVAVDFL